MSNAFKILICLVICVGLVLVLFGKCSVPSIEDQTDKTAAIQFIKVDDLGYNEVWMDRDTRVLYVERGYAMFPLLDADGTARTYEEVYGEN